MPSPGWNDTSAFVSSDCGGLPPFASVLESAMEKQDECAAAINSSGLVFPFASSAREAHETSYVPTPDDSRVTVPEPSFSEPSQWVAAVRVVAIKNSLVCGFVCDDDCSRRNYSTLARKGTIDK